MLVSSISVTNWHFTDFKIPDPGDYRSTTQILTFGPGRASQVNVIIPIVDDKVNEGIEQFFVRLALTDVSTDVDVELSPNETIIEIIDDDCKIQYYLYVHCAFLCSLQKWAILMVTLVFVCFCRA